MIKTQQLLLQREPIKTRSRGASTVKVERSAASNTFTARTTGGARAAKRLRMKWRGRAKLEA
jgi:hypothetical protein